MRSPDSTANPSLWLKKTQPGEAKGLGWGRVASEGGRAWTGPGPARRPGRELPLLCVSLPL